MAYMEAAAPVPWWPSPAMAAAGLLAATLPSANAEPQTLPFLLAPPPPPAGYPLLPPPGPIVLQLHSHPSLLAEVDDHRSRALVQFLKDEGAVPSPEDEKKREQVIRELKKIVVHWAKMVAYEQNVPQRLATATVLTYGSYTLGVHGPESDIDALCVGPCIATLQYHFFVVLRQILEGRPEISEVQAVECAKVPLMRFRFAGIAVDLTYAQLPAIDASNLERAGVNCHPCPSEEVDHTVKEPNMIFYWGLIPETIVHVDTAVLKEDFMKNVTNDVYGKVKCTHSDVTISVVEPPQLPKSMCGRSVHLQYMQHRMLG